MDNFEPIEEHNNFEPMDNFEPLENFSFDKFSKNTDFEPQESYNDNFEPQNDFEPQENFDKFKYENDTNTQQEPNEEDEEINSFKKNSTIAGIVISLILISFFGITFIGANKKTDYTDVIKERKAPVHDISELKIIPNKSIFKTGEQFKFDISRDIIFSGQLQEVLLSFKIPESIPYRQKIENLVIIPTPEIIEQHEDGKYAVIKLQNPKGRLQLHMTGFAKVHTYTPAFAQKMGKNIDGELTAEERQRYTSPEINIESNDKFIKATSSKFIPKATNELDTVKNIYDFVVRTLEYKESEIGKNKGAIEALRSKKGCCMEFANLMVAFCRTKGIPARVIYGFDIPFVDMKKDLNNGHAWVEAYISDYGWVTFDPTNKIQRNIIRQAKDLEIQPFDILSYAFKNRDYLTVDTNEIQMNYKGDGDIKSQNLHVTFSQR